MGAVLEQLDTAIGAALSADLSALDGPGVVDAVERLEIARRRLEAVGHRVVAEVESRRIAGEYAAATTADLLVRRLRVTPREARLRVELAMELTPRSNLIGEQLPPLFEQAAEACLVGDISAEHAVVISATMDKLPDHLDAEQARVAQSLLVDAARHEHPAALRKTAALLLARLDQDGPEPPEPDHLRRDRAFTLRLDGDGTSTPSGKFSKELTALLVAELDSLAAPVPSDDGEPDPRTAAQRRHDALLDLAGRVARSGTLPATGGAPVTVLVTCTVDDLIRARGVALTDRGCPWPLRDLLASTPEAEVVPVLFGDNGRLLNLGRTQRLASAAQRRALAARDGGCSFPQCDKPPAWTQAHHIEPWTPADPASPPGPTDVDNLTLVCGYHHRHFESAGWRVRASEGVVEWIPPPWLDPAQRPRRNRSHHRPELTFDLPRRDVRRTLEPAGAG